MNFITVIQFLKITQFIITLLILVYVLRIVIVHFSSTCIYVYILRSERVKCL